MTAKSNNRRCPNRYPIVTGLVGVLLAVVNGCGTLHTAPQLPANAESTEADFLWPRSDWWTALHDPALNKLIQTGLINNPGLHAVADRIRQAEGLASMLDAGKRPEIIAQGTTGVQHFSSNFIQNKFAGDTFGVLTFSPLTLRWHLDFWGRDRAALDAAIGQVRAREAEYAQARILLSTTMTRVYARLGRLQSRLAQTQHLVALQQESMGVLAARRSSGLDAGQASRLAEIKLAAVQQRARSLQTDIETAQHQLATLVGKPPEWCREVKIHELPLAHTLRLPTQLPLSLLAHRADVIAARWQAETAAQEVKIAQTQFYPDVNLLGFAGFQTVNLTDLLFAGRNAAFALGPSIDLPLFQGGRLEGNLNQKQASFDAAVATFNNTLLRAVQDTADALTRWQDVNARHKQQLAAVAAIKEHARLTRVLHSSGLNSRLQLLESEVSVTEQRDLLITTEAEQDFAAVSLIESLGGGYQAIATTLH